MQYLWLRVLYLWFPVSYLCFREGSLSHIYGCPLRVHCSHPVFMVPFLYLWLPMPYLCFLTGSLSRIYVFPSRIDAALSHTNGYPSRMYAFSRAPPPVFMGPRLVSIGSHPILGSPHPIFIPFLGVISSGAACVLNILLGCVLEEGNSRYPSLSLGMVLGSTSALVNSRWLRCDGLARLRPGRRVR